MPRASYTALDSSTPNSHTAGSSSRIGRESRTPASVACPHWHRHGSRCYPNHGDVDFERRQFVARVRAGRSLLDVDGSVASAAEDAARARRAIQGALPAKDSTGGGGESTRRPADVAGGTTRGA